MCLVKRDVRGQPSGNVCHVSDGLNMFSIQAKPGDPQHTHILTDNTGGICTYNHRQHRGYRYIHSHTTQTTQGVYVHTLTYNTYNTGRVGAYTHMQHRQHRGYRYIHSQTTQRV